MYWGLFGFCAMLFFGIRAIVLAVREPGQRRLRRHEAILFLALALIIAALLAVPLVRR